MRIVHPPKYYGVIRFNLTPGDLLVSLIMAHCQVNLYNSLNSLIKNCFLQFSVDEKTSNSLRSVLTDQVFKTQREFPLTKDTVFYEMQL